MYTDIIEHTYVGDKKAPCLAYVPIDSTFNTLGHYYSNPPQYHRVKMNHLSTIELSLKTHEGKTFPMEEGETVVVLHFHRIFKLN